MIRKGVLVLLLLICFLTGCSDSANEAEAEKVEQISLEQQELILKYEQNIEENLSIFLFRDFYQRFVEGEGEVELNDNIIAVYNKAIKQVIDNGVEDYYFNKEFISEEFVNEANKDYLEEQQIEYIEKTKSILVNFIDNYEKANLDTSVIDDINTFGYLAGNEEIIALKKYIDALRYGDSKSMFDSLLSEVNPYYSGEKGAEIKRYIESEGISLSKWVAIYNAANGTNLTDKGKGIVDYNPAIGMTTEEVESSTWGEPKDINRTVTASSVREQWVYGNGKYLYFENGIMTSFQD